MNHYHRLAFLLIFISSACVFGRSSKSNRARSHAEMLCLSNGIEKGPIRFSGQADKKNIEHVISGAIDDMTDCYQEHVADKKLIDGQFTLQWVLNTCGRVSSPQVVTNSYQSKELNSCLLKSMRGLKFDKPTGRGNVMVTYPISFEIQR